jgi:hypothetical protein
MKKDKFQEPNPKFQRNPNLAKHGIKIQIQNSLPDVVVSKFDDIVKSPVPVIASSPANGGATWQSRYFKNLQKLDRRASFAMTPFSDFLRVHQI